MWIYKGIKQKMIQCSYKGQQLPLLQVMSLASRDVDDVDNFKCLLECLVYVVHLQSLRVLIIDIKLNLPKTQNNNFR